MTAGLGAIAAGLGAARMQWLDQPAAMAQAAALRRAVLPLLMGAPGAARPTAFVEDTAVAPEKLAGFLTACALVKPSRSIHDVEVAGVKKKMKDKAFARAVKRVLEYPIKVITVVLGLDAVGRRDKQVRLYQEPCAARHGDLVRETVAGAFLRA